jgi:hypothetical protein
MNRNVRGLTWLVGGLVAASSNPLQAFDNADNYEFFVENRPAQQ